MNTETSFVGFSVLKQSVSMVQVLDRYGLLESLHQSGDHLSGPCPVHGGHNPSQFRVSLSRDCWICFGDCQAGGSIVDFVSRKEGVGIRDAGLLIQRWFGVKTGGAGRGQSVPGANGKTVPVRWAQTRGEKAANPALQFVLQGLDPTHPYLRERGLLPETIQTFGLGYCSRGWLKGWIAIPIHNPQGQLVAYAGRWPGMPPDHQPRYRLPCGFHKSLELFNLHRARNEDPQSPLFVVEGFFGCMKVWQAGIHRVVAAMGSSLSARQAELIRAATSKVILLFDDDEAGRKGALAAKARLSPTEVQIVSVGPFGRQPEDLTPEQLRSLLGC